MKLTADQLEEVSQYLYKLLDDIDAAGDVAKDNDKLYRKIVENIQKKKCRAVNNCDGYTVKFKPLKSTSGEEVVHPKLKRIANLAKTMRNHPDMDVMRVEKIAIRDGQEKATTVKYKIDVINHLKQNYTLTCPDIDIEEDCVGTGEYLVGGPDEHGIRHNLF